MSLVAVQSQDVRARVGRAIVSPKLRSMGDGMPERGRKRHKAKSRAGHRMTDDEARAALEDSDKIYFRIGEVSQLTDVKAHVLRYWETEFRWMAPPKSRSKQRLYRKRDIEFVRLLKRLLWDERYTIAGARRRIQELGVDDALKLLSQPIGVSAANGAHDSGSEREALDLNSFQAAITEMKTELTRLRGFLEQSA